jgi:hypothetical protein
MTDADPDVFRGRLHKAIGGDSLYSWTNRVNLPASALRTIIRGSIPKADILAKISRATGKTIDWLLGLDIGASETHDDLPVPPPGEFVYIPCYEDVTAAHKAHSLRGCHSKDSGLRRT